MKEQPIVSGYRKANLRIGQNWHGFSPISYSRLGVKDMASGCASGSSQLCHDSSHKNLAIHRRLGVNTASPSWFDHGVEKIKAIDLHQGRFRITLAAREANGSSPRCSAFTFTIPNYSIALGLPENTQTIQVYAHFSKQTSIVIGVFDVIEEDVAPVDLEGRRPSGRR
jgi:hypothetical protein